jgi:hypothetical protein
MRNARRRCSTTSSECLPPENILRRRCNCCAEMPRSSSTGDLLPLAALACLRIRMGRMSRGVAGAASSAVRLRSTPHQMTTGADQPHGLPFPYPPDTCGWASECLSGTRSTRGTHACAHAGSIRRLGAAWRPLGVHACCPGWYCCAPRAGSNATVVPARVHACTGRSSYVRVCMHVWMCP